MSIEILAVGNEVLRGMVVNTNGAFLGRRLNEEGWDVSRQTTLPDEPKLLMEGMKEALDRSSIVIATGGIGPTLDDITHKCASALLKSPGESLYNPLGTAPGFYFSQGKKALFLLPGIPQEMEAMFDQIVLPLIKKMSPVTQNKYRTKIHFSMLREDEVDPLLRELQESLQIEAGIYPSYGSLTVVLRGKEEAAVQEAREKIERQFKEHSYDSPTGKIEEAIQLWMIQHDKTLAVAESCTGGLLSAQLTAIPGASKYFLGGVVSYANSLKENILHVSPETLDSKGAVSAETVREMWSGVLEITGADFGVAISGIAGPTGGEEGKSVGTVEYALGFRDRAPVAGSFYFQGSRNIVILRTTRRILGLIWKQINTT